MQIRLTQNQIAFVSDIDYDFLNQSKWQANYCPCTKGFYVTREYYHKSIRMHQEVAKRMKIIGLTDHIDRNGLNNQRDNLRAATRSQNNANRRLFKNNTSGYYGVYWNANSGKWRAKITFEGNYIHLGLFNTIEEAALAYNEAAIRLFGEFVELNIIKPIVIIPIDPNCFAIQPFGDM